MMILVAALALVAVALVLPSDFSAPLPLRPPFFTSPHSGASQEDLLDPSGFRGLEIPLYIDDLNAVL